MDVLVLCLDGTYSHGRCCQGQGGELGAGNMLLWAGEQAGITARFFGAQVSPLGRTVGHRCEGGR